MTARSSRPRTGVAGTVGPALAAAGTTWLATFAWRGFTEAPARFLFPLLILALVVAATGALARWARLAGPLVVALQVLASGMVASQFLVGSPLPVGSAWARLVGDFEGALTSANQFAPPVPSEVVGVDPFFIAGGLGCLLLVDVLACTLRRVPLAGLPLLAVYSVSVSMLSQGVPWLVFATTAVGFLVMLSLQEHEHMARWGRPLGNAVRDQSLFDVRTGGARTTARAAGGVATLLAVVLPPLVPVLDLNLLSGGFGPGGDGDIQIENPMVDLRRDLRRGEDIPLVRIETDDPNPAYLRIAVLNRFSEDEWSSGDREVPTSQRAAGRMPPLEGVDPEVPRVEYDYRVSMTTDLRSIWLPTQSQISSIDAPGDWRYDLATMDFLSGDDDLTTAGLEYTMTGVTLDLSAVDLSRSASSTRAVDEIFTSLPDGVGSLVNNLAFQVTRDAPTRFEQAVALQDWFREDGGFTYDLSASEGNGSDDLLAFLTEGEGGRTGYCEQFASAMAAMSRSLGIPARVAVGFLRPTEIDQDNYEYSAHDLHAWPELYFPGSGWVRFEPTPPGRASGVPDYTTERLPDVNPNVPGGPRASEEAATGGPSASRKPTESLDADEGAAGAGSSFPWTGLLAGVGGVLVLAALLMLPRSVRRSRSSRRFGAGPEEAWAELRDTALDLRLPWPQDRSPRETKAHLVRYLGAPLDDRTPPVPRRGPRVAPEAVRALDRIVHAVETLRYARTAEPPEALAEDLGTTVAALRGGAPRNARRQAEWWPRSVVSRRSRGRSAVSQAPVTVRHGGVVDHVG